MMYDYYLICRLENKLGTGLSNTMTGCFEIVKVRRDFNLFYEIMVYVFVIDKINGA